MSFSRFGADDSDVYTFPNTEGRLECCACSLRRGDHFTTTDLGKFLQHLEAHSVAGDVVPSHTGEAARAWVAENPDGWGRR